MLTTDATSVVKNSANKFGVVNQGVLAPLGGLGIEVHFKGSNTIHNLLVVAKDKDSTV